MKKYWVTFILLLNVGLLKQVFCAENSKVVLSYCGKIENEFKKYRWDSANCNETSWQHVRNSVNGDPLIWVSFGDETFKKNPAKNITLLMCGVHGDEITPIKFCFDVIKELKQKPEMSEGKLVVVAPIVNPDSFFTEKPTRTNAQGVDVNRNFPTEDWKKLALSLWKKNYKSDIRRFPGTKPMSEPEVVFQVNLIKLYAPGKIISVHAPLTLLDYDGPDDLKHVKNQGKKGYELLVQMSQKASSYQVKKFPYYPGSLGNYAGQERKIPTYTIELPSTDPAQSKAYWELFREAISHALNSDLTAENPSESDKKTQE
ncbi:MAG: M14 family zinc carboxypeptidase [Bacteriovoracaceae bacterium]